MEIKNSNILFFVKKSLCILIETNYDTFSQVEKLDSCEYLQTAQYRSSCKQGAMPVLDS